MMLNGECKDPPKVCCQGRVTHLRPKGWQSRDRAPGLIPCPSSLPGESVSAGEHDRGCICLQRFRNYFSSLLVTFSFPLNPS